MSMCLPEWCEGGLIFYFVSRDILAEWVLGNHGETGNRPGSEAKS